MNPGLILIGVYIAITVALQFLGFLVSEVVEMYDSTAGLVVFLAIFLSMFWIGWPIAVKLTETYVPGAKAS